MSTTIPALNLVKEFLHCRPGRRGRVVELIQAGHSELSVIGSPLSSLEFMILSHRNHQVVHINRNLIRSGLRCLFSAFSFSAGVSRLI